MWYILDLTVKPSEVTRLVQGVGARAAAAIATVFPADGKHLVAGWHVFKMNDGKWIAPPMPVIAFDVWDSVNERAEKKDGHRWELIICLFPFVFDAIDDGRSCL